MTTRVRVNRRVEDFIRALAPELRRAVWEAIKALAKDQGDVKQLEGKLVPYWRLRVGRVRVVYEVKPWRESGRCSASLRVIEPRSMLCSSSCSPRD